MPRNAAGNYTLPLPPVVAGTSIMSSVENTTDSDIATELTNSLDRNGRGGMLAPFKIFDGTAGAPGIGFTLDPDNGFYRIGPDDWAATVAGVKVMEFTSTGITVTGGFHASGSLSAGPTVGSIANAVGEQLSVQAGPGAGDAAYMQFIRPGHFIGYFGLDLDDEWRIGGASYGALSYLLLTERNSFTVQPDNLVTPKNIYAQDLHSVRAGAGAPSGVVFLGNQVSGARYLIYNGATYAFNSANLIATGSLAVGTANPPINTLAVKISGGNQTVTIGGIGVGATVACMNDAGNVWDNLALGGAGAIVGPSFDVATHCGSSTQRWVALWAQNGAIQTSDARQKKNIAPSTLGLAFIEDLNPVSYQWIVEKNVVTRVPDHEEQVPDTYDVDGNLTPAHTVTVYRDEVAPVPGMRTHWGLVAQDVKNAVTAAGVDFAGLYEGTDPAPGMGLAYNEFIAPLIKAVQELSAKVRALEGAPA